MKLYEITSDIKRLEATGLTHEEIADTMESLQMSFDEKANNIAMVNANLNGMIAGVDEEIKRLQLMKKSIATQQKGLTDYLKYNMGKSGISKIECPLFKITLSKARKIVEIDDLDLIPDEYVNVVTTVSPDKLAIAKALKNGAEITGASLADGSQSLLIK